MLLSQRVILNLVLLFLVLSTVFYFFPQIDLAVSGYFWRQGTGFFVADWPPFRWLYVLFAQISVPYAVVLLAYLLVSYLPLRISPFNRSHVLVRYRRDALFLFLVLVMGTILVEVVFKLGWGRARPRDILEFGGNLRFTAAWVFSDQCYANCSFMSGHAAIGFYFMVVAWLKRKPLWILPGLILGLALALTRIAQGGHFISDVILPFFVVIFIAHWIAPYTLALRDTKTSQ